jgi:hypothetical protein
MNIGGICIPRRIAAGGMVIGAVLSLALTNNIDGELALFAILGVGAALGVYERVRGGKQ